jgi:hypothetical protein
VVAGDETRGAGCGGAAATLEIRNEQSEGAIQHGADVAIGHGMPQ